MSARIRQFIPSLALALAMFTFSSCYNSGPSGPPYNSYRNSPAVSSFGIGGGGYGGRGYYGDRYNDNRYYGRNGEQIKLTGGNQRGKPNRPEGYHSPEWYKSRGYDLDKYKHKHEDSGKSHEGDEYRPNNSRSHSKSSHSKSSHSKSSHSKSSRSHSSSSKEESKSRSRH